MVNKLKLFLTKKFKTMNLKERTKRLKELINKGYTKKQLMDFPFKFPENLINKFIK